MFNVCFDIEMSMSSTAATDKMGESVTHEIVDRVAAKEGVNPVELPLLYDTVEPTALQALTTTEGISIRFTYSGHQVLIRDGGVTIDPEDGS